MQKNGSCQFLIAISITLCASVATTTAQEQALPPLSEEIAAQFPAIGRLGQSGFHDKQGCTATLIAPDLIVTAAHCASVSGRSGKVFVAGWLRGDFIVERETQEEMRHPAYAADGIHRPLNDIALVVLKSPIEEVTPIPLGDVEDGILLGTDVALIGYHRQIRNILSGDFDCPVTYFGFGLLHVDCPVINGNSGAPLLNRAADGKWQIVGVVSSQIAGGAIAVELPDWLKREVAAHLTQN